MPKLQHDKINDRYHITIPKDVMELSDMIVGSTIHINLQEDGTCKLIWKPNQNRES